MVREISVRLRYLGLLINLIGIALEAFLQSVSALLSFSEGR